MPGEERRPVDVRRGADPEFLGKPRAGRRRGAPVEGGDAGEKRGVLLEKLAVEIPFKGGRRRHRNRPFASDRRRQTRSPVRAPDSDDFAAPFCALTRR